MMWAALMAAATTGVFCAAFTVVISAMVDQMPLIMAVLLSFVSGFCGSLFARFILKG